jgi:hypothetical protein
MENRYTDEHVRDDESLVDLATKYVTQYAGEFSFLLGVKRAVLTGYTLNVPTVRGVLNCMLGDPNVQNMPTPASLIFDADEPAYKKLARRRDVTVRSSSPYRVPLRTTWKAPYAVSIRPQGKLIHGVDTNRSRLVDWRYNDDRDDRFMWEVDWFCTRSKYISARGDSQYYTKNYRLLTTKQAYTLLEDGMLGDLPELGKREWKACRKCTEMGAMEPQPIIQLEST